MALVSLTNNLMDEYKNLFNTCVIDPNRTALVEKIVNSMIKNKVRYDTVGKKLNIPWFFIAAIHQMEASMNFNCHFIMVIR